MSKNRQGEAPKSSDGRPRTGIGADRWTMPLTASRSALLPAGTDRALRRLVYGLFTMSVRFERIRASVAGGLGLSGIQYHILMVVAERDARGPVTVSTVAETLHASGAYVTTETGKLAARKLLDKRPNPDDGRSVVLTLTDDGRALIDGFAEILREVNDTLFDGIGPETFAQFCAIVEHMVGTTDRAVDLVDRMTKARANGTGEPAAVAAVGR